MDPRRAESDGESERPSTPVREGPRGRRTLRNLLVGKPRDPLDRACFTTSLWSRFSPGSGSAPTDSPPRRTARRRPSSARRPPVPGGVSRRDDRRTVFVISYAYSLLIEHFPGGGGGYLVATKLLGPRVGVVSGCALIVDYVLTITVSVATGCDAVFSFLPAGMGRAGSSRSRSSFSSSWSS